MIKEIFQDIITQDKRLIEILNQFPGIAASPAPSQASRERGQL
jgi:hypothetical protein